METKSILSMARGAIEERADYEMAKIIDNILDPNTSPSKKRELTIKIEITPDSDRQNLYLKCTAKSKLEPTNPVSSSLYISNGESGARRIVEYTPQIPGQIDLSGEVQEAPAVLRLVGGEK